MSYESDQEKLMLSINQDKLVLEDLGKKIKAKEKELADKEKEVGKSIEALEAIRVANKKEEDSILLDLVPLREELAGIKDKIDAEKTDLKTNKMLKNTLEDELRVVRGDLEKAADKLEKEAEKASKLDEKKEALKSEVSGLKDKKSAFENEAELLKEKVVKNAKVLKLLNDEAFSSEEDVIELEAKVKEEKAEIKKLEELKVALVKETEKFVVERDKALEDTAAAKERQRDKNLSIANREVLCRQKEAELRMKCKELNIPYIEGAEPLKESEEIAKLKEKLAGLEEKKEELKMKELEIRANCKRIGVPYVVGEKPENVKEAKKQELTKKELLLEEKERELRDRCELLRVPFDDTDEIEEAANEADKLKDIRLALSNKEFLLQQKEEQLRGKFKELNIPYVE